jgi:hypothetical protein
LLVEYDDVLVTDGDNRGTSVWNDPQTRRLAPTGSPASRAKSDHESAENGLESFEFDS